MIQFASHCEISRDNNRHNILFLADLSCPNVRTSLKMFEERKLFQPPFKWILLDDLVHRSNSSIPSCIEDLEILLNSEVMYLEPLENGYDITFVYKISSGSSWRKEFFGTWTKIDGLKKSKEWIEVTALRRQNIEGYQISICYVLTDPGSINHLEDGVNDHIDTITKVNYPTTNQLLDFMNASKSYLYANTWGYNQNGSWNGMTGYLARGEVEIGGSPMFFTSQRSSVVEYISSPTPTRSKFVFLQPKLSYENNLFLLSFQKYLWYGAMLLVILLFLFLFLITHWEWKKMGSCDEQRNRDPTVLRASILDVAILIFAATCQQGSNVELKGSLGRVVLLILFMALTFLYTSYSANIVALLQSSSSQIRTLDDLLHSRLKFAVHDTVYNRYYFSIETETVRKAIYETKIAPPGVEPRFMAMEEGVKKIQKGLFAFHMETGVGYKFVGKYFEEGEKCGLKEIQYLQVIDPWLAVRKGSVFIEIFKIG
ncbi:ionotropic receptor 75a-like isoform X2 [Leptidea sinapis]|nr:ionotropic receptor 75a-like isoform X2 [Leptidea sinapis]